MKYLTLFFLMFFCVNYYSQEIEGRWYGILDVADKEYLFAFDLDGERKLFNPKNDKLFNKIDSVFIQGASIIFYSSEISMKYEGELKNDTIKGFWSQSGMAFPLTLTRTKPKLRLAKTKTLNRPQTPEFPFDYYTKELLVFNSIDSVSLSGTLTLPTNDGKKYPVVILVTGSSPQNRDSEILKHKSFAVIADHLAKQGIGSFRYDDRGVAKSTGTYAGSDLHDFYRDLDAVVQRISKRKEVSKLGIAGHSEGAILGPWYASEHRKEIDFVIMLSGPGIPIKDMMHLQREAYYKSIGMTEEFIEQEKKMFIEIDKIVLNTQGVEKTTRLTEVFTKVTETKKMNELQASSYIKAQMSLMDGAWYKSFVSIVPESYLKNLKCPVLALGGLKDFQIPTEINFEAILKHKKQSYFGKPSLTTISYSNLNHLFQPCETGTVNEYGKIETTIDRRVLFDISDFIKAL